MTSSFDGSEPSLAELDRMRTKIKTQADIQGVHGWIKTQVPFEMSATATLRVPRGALEMWSVSRSGGSLDLTAMCPSGGFPHWEALRERAPVRPTLAGIAFLRTTPSRLA